MAVWDRIISSVRSVQASLIEFGLYVNWSVWLGLTIMFLGFTVFAFKFPDSFVNDAAGIGFLGVTLSLLVMFFYIGDKIRDKENTNKIEERLEPIKKMAERLEHIEKMAEKWDFVYDDNF